MYTIFVSDTILVIDYAYNAMLVEVHRCPQNKDANKSKHKRIKSLLSFKQIRWVFVSYVVFCLPVILYVITHNKESLWTIQGGWDSSITTDLRNVCIIQCALLLSGTSIHGCVIGPGVRNTLILRNPYHLTQRLLATCFILYLVVAVVVPADDVKLRLALGSTITHLTIHIVFTLHLLLPLRRTRSELCLPFQTTPFNDKDSWEALHAELLSLFLATSGGFTQYTNFMQVHLLPVVWVLAYHDITQRTLLPQALYNLYIRRSSTLCMCKYFPGAMLKELDITFERNVITSGSKDLYEMFDPLAKLLLQLLVIETFPQFQLHPLGCVWQSFVENCGDQVKGYVLHGMPGNRPLSPILSGGTYLIQTKGKITLMY
ncbi:hypothetical protein THRCLA_10878 [Thraustotheca clavata]|uniref:RGS domain-containing protein n=1 Tax=Thraustotheca clavata TaxID=74557 RepID=A0A1V9YEB6_9STRA|nr:hypothetical protein THRCLA_10878 [Thraustotheca clavata]